MATVIGVVVVLLAGVAYAVTERRAYTLRRFTLPVLPPGSTPVTLLHLSDLHLVPRQKHRIDWVRSLAELDPDLVISTGDNLAASDAVPAVLEAHGELLARPGAFVLGSNDYFSPRAKNPARYLLRNGGRSRRYGPDLPFGELVAGFEEAGWLNLANRRGSLEVRGMRFDLVGVDDPHLDRDRYELVAGPADPSAALTIGVAHAPYRRVIDSMAADGAGLLLTGHTHGGQLRLPWYGALVTNCDLPRRYARGLFRWPPAARGRAAVMAAGAEPGETPERTWLHVTAGIGTSPYAPIRFACRPEASLLTLVPRTG
jgi:predicted MPP superfamily phosphohydrolase